MSTHTVSIRDAKAHFSALVAEAAKGAVITVTSHGVPKARLAPCDEAPSVPMEVDRDWLQTMPIVGDGVAAEALIREERDGRG